MNKTVIKIRGIVALSMNILISIMFVTGLVLWLASQGVMNNATLWNIAFRIHPLGGWGMFLLGMVHLGLNTKLFLSDLRAWRRKSP